VLLDAARRAGYEPMPREAGRLILGGECSVAEAARVLGTVAA
jgi:hypothetical protein